VGLVASPFPIPIITSVFASLFSLFLFSVHRPLPSPHFVVYRKQQRENGIPDPPFPISIRGHGLRRRRHLPVGCPPVAPPGAHPLPPPHHRTSSRCRRVPRLPPPSALPDLPCPPLPASPRRLLPPFPTARRPPAVPPRPHYARVRRALSSFLPARLLPVPITPYHLRLTPVPPADPRRSLPPIRYRPVRRLLHLLHPCRRHHRRSRTFLHPGHRRSLPAVGV
jgi:hypothetical protein